MSAIHSDCHTSGRAPCAPAACTPASAASPAPRLREDLTHRVRDDGGREAVFLVTDTGEALLVGIDEWKILRCLDGSPLRLVRDRLRHECGFELEPGELESAVAAAAQAGLLEESGRDIRRRWINPLFVKVPLCNPDRALGRLEPMLRFMLVPAVWWVGALIVLAGAWSLGGWWPRIGPVAGGRLWLVFGSVIAVGTLHELGHALTLKHFGGRVREAGFLVNWFIPSFYCDVTDAYLLERKRDRIAVILAGPFVQAVAGAGCALLLSLPVTTPALTAALGAGVMMGFLAPMNFLPLLRSDGYYLLAECVDIPNLRLRARAYLGLCLFRRPERPTPVSRRDHVILLLFGTLALAFGTLVLALIGARAWSALAGDRISSVWAMALAVVLVVHGLYRSTPQAPGSDAGSPARRLWGRPWGRP